MTFQPYVQAPLTYRLRRSRRTPGDRVVMVCVLCGAAIMIAAAALMGILALMYPGA